MPSRRALNGVLAGFLGTYVSRYSEFDGYWLFGFLVMELDTVEFDLLEMGEDRAESPLASARNLAAQKFAEQLAKSGLDRSRVREARLVIDRAPDDGSVPGQHFRGGFNLSFRAAAIADNERRFRRETKVFVAPHDPRLESQSAPADL